MAIQLKKCERCGREFVDLFEGYLKKTKNPEDSRRYLRVCLDCVSKISLYGDMPKQQFKKMIEKNNNLLLKGSENDRFRRI